MASADVEILRKPNGNGGGAGSAYGLLDRRLPLTAAPRCLSRSPGQARLLRPDHSRSRISGLPELQRGRAAYDDDWLGHECETHHGDRGSIPGVHRLPAIRQPCVKSYFLETGL